METSKIVFCIKLSIFYFKPAYYFQTDLKHQPICYQKLSAKTEVLKILLDSGVRTRVYNCSVSESAFQIGEISKRAGVTIDAIRYYEKRKLIHNVSRTSGGFRLFKLHTVERIKFIKQAQEFGFSLEEIKGLLGSGSDDECQKVRNLLEQKISEVDEQIQKMKIFRKTLSSHLKACEEELSQNGKNASCPTFFEIKRGKKNEGSQ